MEMEAAWLAVKEKLCMEEGGVWGTDWWWRNVIGSSSFSHGSHCKWISNCVDISWFDWWHFWNHCQQCHDQWHLWHWYQAVQNRIIALIGKHGRFYVLIFWCEKYSFLPRKIVISSPNSVSYMNFHAKASTILFLSYLVTISKIVCGQISLKSNLIISAANSLLMAIFMIIQDKYSTVAPPTDNNFNCKSKFVYCDVSWLITMETRER